MIEALQTELNMNGYPVWVDLPRGRSRLKVACLGPEGTYTEAARFELLGKHLSEMDADFVKDNVEIVRKVEAGDYDIGIAAIENAINGDVVEVIRELNHIRDITILGEVIIGIQHALIGHQREEIDVIYSHQQGLGQCRSYLLEHYPDAKQEQTDSTAAAVEMARDNLHAAAIASQRAAQIYRMPILAEDVGDVKGNSTRFLLIGRGETKPTGHDSTALIFVPTGDRPGILARCLTTLASYGINLTKLDSRPTGTMREYAFWATMDGHYKDEMVGRGIDDLRQTYCSSLRILGSYRKATLPEGVREPGAINGQH